MVVYGVHPSRLIEQFPLEEMTKIIKLILKSWESFRVPLRYEDKITNKFYAHLINNKDRTKHYFTIIPRPAEIDEYGEEIGEIDLKIIYNNQEKTYFSFECKRLRVHFSSGFDNLAGKYVTEGMSRYFNGQYARDLDKGGMLGYVMDGNCNEAVKDVQKAIERRRLDLYMQDNETLKDSTCIISRQVKETLHKYGPKEKFIIYHIFLPMNVTLNTN